MIILVTGASGFIGNFLLTALWDRRSFIHVENLVDVIVACLGNPKAFGKTYLPSDGEDVSTPELIRKIAKANQSFQCSEFSKQCAGRSALDAPYGSSLSLKAFSKHWGASLASGPCVS
jgi:nucleoside-diphosphate-sugar epimerase